MGEYIHITFRSHKMNFKSLLLLTVLAAAIVTIAVPDRELQSAIPMNKMTKRSSVKASVRAPVSKYVRKSTKVVRITPKVTVKKVVRKSAKATTKRVVKKSHKGKKITLKVVVKGVPKSVGKKITACKLKAKTVIKVFRAAQKAKAAASKAR